MEREGGEEEREEKGPAAIREKEETEESEGGEGKRKGLRL